MKTKLLLLVAMLFTTTGMVFAQSADNEDEVVKIDKWNQQAFREGEILVKFKADCAVQMRAPRKATIKYSTIVAATLPLLCVYPFLQKYFVKGVMIGSIKG